jgi:hypothetical protein
MMGRGSVYQISNSKPITLQRSFTPLIERLLLGA